MTIEEARALWEPEGIYLNTASYGLPPRPAWDALQAALSDWRVGRTSWEHWNEAPASGPRVLRPALRRAGRMGGGRRRGLPIRRTRRRVAPGPLASAFDGSRVHFGPVAVHGARTGHRGVLCLGLLGGHGGGARGAARDRDRGDPRARPSAGEPLSPRPRPGRFRHRLGRGARRRGAPARDG